MLRSTRVSFVEEICFFSMVSRILCSNTTKGKLTSRIWSHVVRLSYQALKMFQHKLHPDGLSLTRKQVLPVLVQDGAVVTSVENLFLTGFVLSVDHTASDSFLFTRIVWVSMKNVVWRLAISWARMLLGSTWRSPRSSGSWYYGLGTVYQRHLTVLSRREMKSISQSASHRTSSAVTTPLGFFHEPDMPVPIVSVGLRWSPEQGPGYWAYSFKSMTSWDLLPLPQSHN